MVKGLALSSDGRQATVTVALTVAGCPMRNEITERVTTALTGVGVEDVEVQLTVMSEAELAGVRDKMRSHQGGAHSAGTPGAAGHTLGHESGVPNPFMAPDS